MLVHSKTTTIIFCVVLCFLLDVLFLAAGAKGKLDPDLIPPDITLPTASSSPPPANPADPNKMPSFSNSAQPAASATTTPAASPNAPTSGPQPAPVDPQKPDPVAVIETDKGSIVIRLFRKLAPRTVANFVDLAGKGFYNNSSFHRVEPGFCIQGGDPRGDGSGVYFEPGGQVRLLSLESCASLKHNSAGVVAMAHFPRNPDTASCQFYITLAPQPALDGQYSIFGGVINGMDVVKGIAKGDKIKRIIVQEQQ